MPTFVRSIALVLAMCLSSTAALTADTTVVDSSIRLVDSNTTVVDSSIRLVDSNTTVVDSPLQLMESGARPLDAGAPPETLHVTAGFSAAMFSGGIAALFLAHTDRRTRIATVAGSAFGSALAAGIAKEVADMMGFGTPSIRDVFITAAGGALGTLLVTAGAGLPTDRDSGRAVAAASTATGIVFSVPVTLDLLSRIFHD